MNYRQGFFDNQPSFDLYNDLKRNPQMNSYKITSNNPNTSLPYITRNVGHSFADQFKQLQQIENKLHQYQNQQLPQISIDTNKILQECSMKKLIHEQSSFYKNNNSKIYDNNSNSNNLKDKFDSIKQIKAQNKPDQKSPIEEEYDKLIDYIDHKEFKKSMNQSLGQICQLIKEDINNENQRAAKFMNEIKKGILDIKSGLTDKITNNQKEANQSIKEIEEVMKEEKSKSTRMKYLANKIFPKAQIDLTDDEDKKREEEDRKAINRLNPVSPDNQNGKFFNINLVPIYEDSSYLKDEDVKFNNLDLRQLYLREQMKVYKEVQLYLLKFTPPNYEFRAINKFRSYAYFIIAARRICNIQYDIYSKIKFESVHYFIDNYEDMDIIFKKLMYNSIKPVLFEILNEKILDLNIAIKKPNSHDLFLILKDVLEGIIIEGLNNTFFQGISNHMLKFLGVLISNYAYVPRDFYSTFELVRFRTTKTGELIDLNRESQKMILGFYLIIKILLKNLLLELLFNERSIKSLSTKIKLNIKMVVSIIYRGIIKEFRKCPTQRNATEIEDPEDTMNFEKIMYQKKQFLIETKFKRVKTKTKKRKADEVSKNSLKKKKNLDEEQEQDKVIEDNSVRKKTKKKRKVQNNNEIDENIIQLHSIQESNEQDEIEQIDKRKKKRKKKTTTGKKRKKSPNINNDDVDEEENEVIQNERPKAKKKKKKIPSDNFIQREDELEENVRKTIINLQPVRREPDNKIDPPLHPYNTQIYYSHDQVNSDNNINDNDINNNKNTSKKKRKKKPKTIDIVKDQFESPPMTPIKSKKKKKNNTSTKQKLIKQRKFLLNQQGHIIQSQIPINQISEFSEEETLAMSYIIQNLPDYGQDSNPHEFEFIDNLVYPNEFLERYELFREEYQFDPIQPIMAFIDKLYDMILSNFPH